MRIELLNIMSIKQYNEYIKRLNKWLRKIGK